jgi:uncharacterized membrane protein YphA (DoxX/SURF4 family)
LSVAFIGQGVESLRNPRAAADAARPTVEGLQRLPAPEGTTLPTDAQKFAQASAVVQIGAGVLLATGKLPRTASAALAATVIPANLGSHMFWTEDDPQRKAEKRRGFLTDVSLLGGLVIASADTAGRPSLGWRGRRAAERFSETVASALPGGGSESLLDSDFAERLGHGLQVGAEHGRELVSAASEKSAPAVEAALKRGGEFAEIARERGGELAETARERGAEAVDSALRRNRRRKRFARLRKLTASKL